MLEADSAFARQEWRGSSGSLIIEVERRVLELKLWEISLGFTNVCVSFTTGS